MRPRGVCRVLALGAAATPRLSKLINLKYNFLLMWGPRQYTFHKKNLSGGRQTVSKPRKLAAIQHDPSL